jgi:transposase
MLRPKHCAQVYLYSGIVDMRKSIDGLASLVELELDLSPMNEALCVFCNRKRDKIKLLYWERNGFILWYKRLEKQRFNWLSATDEAAIIIDGYQLNLLLDGLDIFNNKPHETLSFSTIN